MMVAGTRAKGKRPLPLFCSQFPSRKAACRACRHAGRASREAYFQVSIGSPPQKCYARQPVLAIDGLPRMAMFLRRQDPRHRVKLGSRNDSSDRAWSNPHPRIVADPLVLSHHGAGHHVELAVLFSKPHRRGNASAILAIGGQGNILLA